MHDRLLNLIGAAALAAVDLTKAAVDDAGGRDPSWSAALVTLLREPGCSTSDLGRHVKLTQPAACRLVDGLEAQGLVAREAGTGRSVPLRLTSEGESAARRLLGARRQALDGLVAPLDDGERADLERILEKVLDGAFDGVRSAFVMCRLCDHIACVGGGQACPVSQASRERGEHA